MFCTCSIPSQVFSNEARYFLKLSHLGPSFCRDWPVCCKTCLLNWAFSQLRSASIVHFPRQVRFVPICYRYVNQSSNIATHHDYCIAWAEITVLDVSSSTFPTIVLSLAAYEIQTRTALRAPSLTLASNIADSFLIISFCILHLDFHQNRKVQLLAKCGILEALGISALLLGCNNVDFIALMVLSLIRCWDGLADLTQRTVSTYLPEIHIAHD